MQTRPGRLRDLIQKGPMMVGPGAIDGLTAKLIEQAGFPMVYMTGAGTSLSRGFPDLGLLTMSEMVENAGVIARSVAIPVLADADTGYGNELNVTRTVREYERRGVAGIHLEDQVSPKRCGHMEGKEIVGREEYLSKIRAAVRARTTPDFLIIARTDARTVAGFDEAVARANGALEIGADVAFVEAPQSVDEIAAIPNLIRGPCLHCIAPGGNGPVIGLEDAEEMGYRLALVPGLLVTAIIESCDAALQRLASHRYPGHEGAGMTIADLHRRFGSDEWDALRMP
ncbi:MAG TPA: isocitrate lyase/PEP mutase family protein [Ramlibacter sp.]|uniref:isocitrate lyase/PEP mutase family protein n=1 Tax=Ramlibacter sp. TaxID=1917967 RepID=UPI002C55F7AC|nr:isocitrate lyase/PEP mutase family protein [Ramlibacter sp.]HVZ42191.1 isocitrate lyase/PEP mutase family protein [Ramlibacter sp.]